MRAVLNRACARIPTKRLHSSISEALNGLVESGVLKEDAAQQRAAKRLSKLQGALENYDNHPLVHYYGERQKVETANLQQSEFSGQKDDQNTDGKTLEGPQFPSVRIPRGLYIFGEVGTGKSMLMDTFYDRLPLAKKRRVHFHAFLQEVHQRIHSLKQQDLALKGRDFHVDTTERNNPIVRVAKQLASEVSVLCFDEFQVTDVADALILKQLFSTLFQYGTVIIATSNRPPTDLYEGGINRSYFLPFVDLMEHHCIVHKLESEVDYRRLLTRDMESFFLVGSKQKEVNEMFDRLLNSEVEVEEELSVGFQRSLHVKRAHPEGIVARFAFEELCRRDVGAADYRAVAKKYRLVLLEDIPRLNLKQHNEARRFITLVDELYEQRCALMCTSQYPPEELFINRHDDGTMPTQVETKVGEAFGIDVAQSTGKTLGELASVRELSFAFQRAASRLSEMCSKRWWDETLVSR